MAAYHFTAKAVSRGKGGSAVHTAAYNARCQLEDEREGRFTKDYSKRGDVLFSGIFAPKDAPAWATDREQLWNKAEAAEKRVDAQTARNIEFALPHELTPEQMKRLVTDFARETFARRGMVADVSIHPPDKEGDQRNYHVHCLVTMRKIEGDEFAPTKAREWNSKAELGEWREKWANMGARALERAGFEVEAERFKHGHQPLAEQRAAALARGDKDFAASLDRDPTQHQGVAATAMQRRGEEIDRQPNTPASAAEKALQSEIKATEAELAAARKEAPREQPKAAQPIPKPEPIKTVAAVAPVQEKAKPAAEKPEDKQTAQQKAWREKRDAEVSRVAAPKTPDPMRKGIGVAGMAGSVADVAMGFLASLGGSSGPAPKKFGFEQAAQQQEQQRKAIAALERIQESMERGERLQPSDLKNLTPTHLQNIARQGDKYITDLVEQMERDNQREREERDFGRTRER